MTASHYQLIHSGALLAASLKGASLGGSFMIAGILGFSGSIYGLVLIQNPSVRKVLGPITPLGGLCLIAGWTCLAFL